MGDRKLLVVGIDGLRRDRIADARAPRLSGLIAGGLFAPSRLDLRGAQSMSGPGWSTIATGVWADRHGVVDNEFGAPRFDRYPGFLTRAARAGLGLTTMAAVSWPPLAGTGLYSAGVDVVLTGDGEELGYLAEDRRLVPQAAAHLAGSAATGGGPDASFVYLGAVDIAGHDIGAASREYLDAIEAVDALLGTVLDAVASRRTRADERWLILVTTDHGHLDSGGHGGGTDHECDVFVVASGDGVAPGVHQGGALVDVAATALHHLGVPVPADLEGRPLVG